MNKKVAVFGSTGLIGSHLIKLLEKDSFFSIVNTPTRSVQVCSSSKIKNYVIDFKDYNSYVDTIKGCDAVFISIGTTQSKVNWNKNKYIEIDYGIPKNIGKACKECNVKKILLVSSVGADINAKGFYLRLKGKIENFLIDCNIKNTFIFRPSLLLGVRREKRIGERIAQLIMPALSFLLPKKYWPINSKDVAKSMVNLSKKSINSYKVYHYEDIIVTK